jgi:heat shock protein HtpX
MCPKMNDESGNATVEVSEDAYRRVQMLKAEMSLKKGGALTWNEFFHLLVNRERKKKDLANWLYTFGIFLAITFVLMFPFYLLWPLTIVSMIPLFFLIGFIFAFLSAYILTPLSLRKAIKPYDNAPLQVTKCIEEFSKKTEIKKVPRLMIMDTPEVNAFAYASLSGGRICVTKGLMDAYQNGKLEEKELKAILGHELGHIKNRDCLKSGLVLSWISIFDTIGNMFIVFGTVAGVVGVAANRRASSDEETGLGFAMAIGGWVSIIIGFLTKIIAKVASALAFHLSRKQEYLADEAGAELAGPTASASALGKIKLLDDELVKKELNSLPYADRWQIQPRNPSAIDRLFDTHPPIEKREETLKKMGEYLL